MTQQELINEEQKILDDLIEEMDEALLQLNKRLSRAELQKRKAAKKCLPEAYGELMDAEFSKRLIREDKKDLLRARDALYTRRIVLDTEERLSYRGADTEIVHDQMELKIGAHTFQDKGNVYIVSWLRPVCRHYLLDNSAREYDGEVTGVHGTNRMHCVLTLKRDVEMFFDEIRSVVHLYPELGEDAERILSDAFLKELLNRRSEQEFKNIIFSIQKHQGEIIQTPFRQNLIVQGCAGSGKSMIMLHRLPILLYDNPNSLDRNGLYIITPSLAYIQMADNMRRDLEIEDLKMGTLQQYYDHLIQKYGRTAEGYGKVPFYGNLPESAEQYVYSDECIKNIRQYIQDELNRSKIDLSEGARILGKQTKDKRSTMPLEQITAELNSLQNILDENRKHLWAGIRKKKELYSAINRLANALNSRQGKIKSTLEKSVSNERKNVRNYNDQLKEISEAKDPVAYKNLQNSIDAAQKRIPMLQAMIKIVERDKTYFQKLLEISIKLRFVAAENVVEEDIEKKSISAQYEVFEKAAPFAENVKMILSELDDCPDSYWMYDNSLEPYIEAAKKSSEAILQGNELLLPKVYADELTTAGRQRDLIRQNMVRNAFMHQLDHMSLLKDDNSFEVYSFSPYLYLQVLYCWQGAPSVMGERLITIDEAQNVSPQELKLIKAVNGPDLVFNLFGDVKQHIERSKGFDDWKEIRDIAPFQQQEMLENYRNARQITEFCNRKFHMTMRAINLDGAGVHDLTDDDFQKKITAVFQKPRHLGLRVIIVKRRQETEALKALFPEFRQRCQDLTGETGEINPGKWNIMTVDQVKGLEFEAVIAVSGRMTNNEKYIAYTRALNELYVYEKELPLTAFTFSEVSSFSQREGKDDRQNTPGQKDSGLVLKKRVSRKNTSQAANNGISVADFFKSRGLTVSDQRNKNGFLWVIGNREDIEPIINEAVEKFGITGVYGSGKSSQFRPGWYTKTKL